MYVKKERIFSTWLLVKGFRLNTCYWVWNQNGQMTACCTQLTLAKSRIHAKRPSTYTKEVVFHEKRAPTSFLLIALKKISTRITAHVWSTLDFLNPQYHIFLQTLCCLTVPFNLQETICNISNLVFPLYVAFHVLTCIKLLLFFCIYDLYLYVN